MSAALVVAVLAVGALSAPFASADDLKDKQKAAEQDIQHAKKDLDESSTQMARARARLQQARTQLSAAEVALATAQGKVSVAQERDAEMQIALTDAEAELAAGQRRPGRRPRGHERPAGPRRLDDLLDLRAG